MLEDTNNTKEIYDSPDFCIDAILDKFAAIKDARHGSIICPEEQYMLIKALLRLSVEFENLKEEVKFLKQQITNNNK
jgi:hypothetical protein